MSSGSTSPGNTNTRDKVIRREFRLNEGDAFNALKVKRSQDRIQSLGFFQDKLEIKQTEGSTPDKVVLGVNVEEKSTGQVSLSGGYSSLEKFVIQLVVSQNNFMGKGQTVDAVGELVCLLASRSRSGFTEPYLFDKQILFGGAAVPPRLQAASTIFGQYAEHDLFAAQHRRRASSRLPDHRIRVDRHPLLAGPDKVSLDKAPSTTDPDGTGRYRQAAIP